MLGSDLIKEIVDKDLVDKEIVVIGNANEFEDLETESAQVESLRLVEELGMGVITFDGNIEQ